MPFPGGESLARWNKKVDPVSRETTRAISAIAKNKSGLRKVSITFSYLRKIRCENRVQK
jgi:hypothetical protein